MRDGSDAGRRLRPRCTLGARCARRPPATIVAYSVVVLAELVEARNAAVAQRALGPNAPATEIAQRLPRRPQRHAPAPSTCIRRLLILTEPPSIDAGEITDKGYVNQRAVLDRRTESVAELYAEPPGPALIEIPVPRQTADRSRSGEPLATS